MDKSQIDELNQRLDSEYDKHIISLTGKRDDNPSFGAYSNWHLDFWNGMDDTIFSRACTAIEQIKQNYDLGVALATDGLYLGFIGQYLGFPILNAKLSRRGKSASWRPIDDFSREKIQDKNVVLLDNDCVTGRTLTRAAKEVSRFQPKTMDLLLIHETTPVSKCRDNVPPFFDKVMTLGKDFYTDPQAVQRFYEAVGRR